MKKIIYMDNNATTKISPEVFLAMQPFLKKFYGNPSSMHSFGGQLNKIIENARKKVANLINAEPDEIIFTSGGTESDNTAIMSAINIFPYRKHVITSKVEHPAILNFCKHLQRNGYKVSYIPVNQDGTLNLKALYSKIDNNTAIVSIMYANNETGILFPIAEIAEFLKEKDILFHSDAIQVIGKIPINMKKVKLDMMSISGHKFHAPKGIGVLYVRRGTRFCPSIIGGHQENGRRAGTENLASIVGIGKASELAHDNLFKDKKYICELRNKLEKGILTNCTDTFINGNTGCRIPNTTNISFKWVEGEAILLRLNEYGICASSGSACSSGSLEPSHVLRSMGIPVQAIHGSIRFSLSKYNTYSEIKKVIKIIPQIIKQLRRISPFKKKEENICKIFS